MSSVKNYGVDVCKNICIMTSSNGNIFSVIGHLCGELTGPGEFPAQRPVTWSFDVFFDLSLNKWLSKQSWGWWFETQSHPLCHCNALCQDKVCHMVSWVFVIIGSGNGILPDGTMPLPEPNENFWSIEPSETNSLRPSDAYMSVN